MFEKPTRNHVTIVFERLGGMFFVLLLIVWSNLQGNAEADIFSADFWREMGETAQGVKDYYYAIGAVAVLAVIAIILLISLRFWSKTVFYIENGYLIYKRDTMFRKMSRLPLDIITTVNLERNVFERIVGTAKVKLDINSAQTSNSTDFTLVLSLKTAQSFKDTITRIKSESVGEKATLVSDAEVIIAFTPAQVVRHKLLSLPILQGLVTVGVFASQMFGANFSETKNALLFLVICGVAAVVVSIFNTLDYTVSMDKKNIYITKGRLKKVSYTFSRSRINAVFVKQPMLARIFGYSSVEVAVIGLGNEKNETPCLCLLSNKEQTERILNLCAANFVHCGGESVAQSRAALIPGAFCLTVISSLSLLTLILPQISFAGVVIVSIIAVTAALIFMSYRTKSFRADESVFHNTRGIFTKQTGMFRYDRLQTVKIKTNFVMAKAKTEKMEWSILSGAAMKTGGSGWFRSGIFENIGERTVMEQDASTRLLGE